MHGMYLGVVVACLWAGADICGASSPLSTLKTTLTAQWSGLLALALAFAVMLIPEGEQQVDKLAHLPWGTLLVGGMLLGAISAGGYLALYFALARGPLAIVSPLVSAQGAIPFLGALLLLHESVHQVQVGVLCIVLLGIIFAMVPPSEAAGETRQRSVLLLTPGILCALIALLGFGLQSFALGAVVASYGMIASLAMLLCMRLFAVLFLMVLATLMQETGSEGKEHLAQPTLMSQPKGRWKQWGMAVLVGLLDMSGLVLFSLSASFSSTMLTGVLSSTYPIFPLLYGVWWKRERVSLVQTTGMVCIVSGMVLLSLDRLFSAPLMWSLCGVLSLCLVSAALLARLRLPASPERSVWEYGTSENGGGVCRVGMGPQEEDTERTREQTTGNDHPTKCGH